MPLMQWHKSPMEIVQAYEIRHPGSNIGPLAMWAAWSVESLHYLADIDQLQIGYPASVAGHHADVIDIAHVRWATGTAITSLDLCAATAGRLFCGSTKTVELDLRAFQTYKRKHRGLLRRIQKRIPSKYRPFFDHRFQEKRSRQVQDRRAKIPIELLAWIDDVLSDQRYIDIHGARNRFTHAWLSRTLPEGGTPGHAERTGFRIRKSDKALNAREMVEMAQNLATDQVTSFFNLLDGL